MVHYLKYAACVLLLAACSPKSAEQSPPATAPAAAAPPATTAAPADTAVARQPLTLAQLPAALRPVGKLLEAWRWMDANGENTLVASRTVVAGSADVSDARTARLLVRQSVRHGGSYQQLWQLQDAVADCPVDLWLGLLPGSLRVTDLDHNGRTETTVLYGLACKGDISPLELKLIMHEGAAKYALRGTAIEMAGGPDDVARSARMAAGPVCCAQPQADSDPDYRRYEGQYDSEKDFVNAPPAFLAFAQRQWRRGRTHAEDGSQAL